MEIQQLHCLEESIIYLHQKQPRMDERCSAVLLPSTSGLISLKHLLPQRQKVKKDPLKQILTHQKASETFFRWVLF